MNHQSNSTPVKIIYLPSFNRQLKKIHDNPQVIKSIFKKKLIKYIQANPNAYQFPNSGAGIGNVWKLRVKGRGGYRIIYFAEPRHFVMICIYIYPKNKQVNLTSAQKQAISSLTNQLKKAVNHESEGF